MSFFETLGKVASSVKSDFDNYRGEYNAFKSSYGERYSKMSNAQLKSEYNRLKSGVSGSTANAAGRCAAFNEEVRSRANSKK